MIAFDTNVLLRVLLGDDPDQTAIAERHFLEHTRGDGVLVGHIVLAELAWCMAAAYRLSSDKVRERIASLIRTQGVFVPDLEVVLEALRRDQVGTANFADYLIIAAANAEGASPLLTFDRKLAREPDALLAT
jgi:predicted nucleic-acid-binding protein